MPAKPSKDRSSKAGQAPDPKKAKTLVKKGQSRDGKKEMTRGSVKR